MENKNIQSEVEKTLNSLSGLQKAEANAFLYEKVMSGLQKSEARVIPIAPRIIWQAAACFAALIVVNVFVWTKSADTNETSQTKTENTNPVAQEYFSYINTAQF